MWLETYPTGCESCTFHLLVTWHESFLLKWNRSPHPSPAPPFSRFLCSAAETSRTLPSALGGNQEGPPHPEPKENCFPLKGILGALSIAAPSLKSGAGHRSKSYCVAFLLISLEELVTLIWSLQPWHVSLDFYGRGTRRWCQQWAVSALCWRDWQDQTELAGRLLLMKNQTAEWQSSSL